jgi:hypothetical protein
MTISVASVIKKTHAVARNSRMIINDAEKTSKNANSVTRAANIEQKTY